MSELVMLPEMLTAGMEAYAESKDRKLTDADIVISVYLAMRDIEEIYQMRKEAGGLVH